MYPNGYSFFSLKIKNEKRTLCTFMRHSFCKIKIKMKNGIKSMSITFLDHKLIQECYE